jgi:predicted GTPase
MSIQNLENKYNTLQSNNQEQIRNLKNENMNLKRRMEKENNQMNVKNQQLERNIQSLEDQNKNIKAQYESLKSENQTNKNQLDSLTVQHNNLKKKQEEEEHKKEEKKKNLENYRNTFKKDKEVIENKNIQESKSYITVFIINEFVKGFEKTDNNKDNFSKSLSKYMNKFTEEFMSYCNPFISSFKTHSQKIIQNYKVNESKLSIEHINFIVIGKAGIGKSSFINESLLLEGNKRAKEGKGISVTDKSTLYCSEKLKMIRMWDTQGLDYKITQAYILNEIKRLVNEGLKNGPDYYINIILYCTKGDRFQEEDGQLINEIMKLYPMDNLPVIITQLQAYFQEDSIEMENTIRDILQNYLEYKIVKKIEITSIVSRDKKVGNITYKARGIPELLRSSFDIMGRSITSATFKKFSQDIEDLCKNFVDIKIDYLKSKSKDEMEVLDIRKIIIWMILKNISGRKKNLKEVYPISTFIVK